VDYEIAGDQGDILFEESRDDKPSENLDEFSNPPSNTLSTAFSFFENEESQEFTRTTEKEERNRDEFFRSDDSHANHPSVTPSIGTPLNIRNSSAQPEEKYSLAHSDKEFSFPKEVPMIDPNELVLRVKSDVDTGFFFFLLWS
jgi:hypothetical protein